MSEVDPDQVVDPDLGDKANVVGTPDTDDQLGRVTALHGLARAQMHSRLRFVLLGLKNNVEALGTTTNPDDMKPIARAAIGQCQEMFDVFGHIPAMCDAMGINGDRTFVLGMEASFHDIKNILGGLFGLLHFVLDDMANPGDLSKIQQQLNSVHYCEKVVNQTFYHGETIDYDPLLLIKTVDRRIAKMVHDSFAKIAAVRGEANPTITVETDYVRPFNSDTRIKINLVRVIEVFRNLAANAIDFGARKIRILLSDGGDDFVCIRVQNSGKPISAEHIPHVFDAGYTSHSEGEEVVFGGKGIGLAGAKLFVEQLGGRFEEPKGFLGEDEGGLNGPEFVFYLPKAKG